MITFRCTRCSKDLQVFDDALGKNVKCPHCGAVVVASPAVVAVVTSPAPVSAAPQGLTTDAWGFLERAQQPDELGRLGPYRVLKLLGAGAQGVVFHAEDPMLGRRVALKVMLPSVASDPAARDRFVHDARLTAALKHPHIVTVHQVGEDRGTCFLAMEFLEGESLEARINRPPRLTMSETLRIGREIAEGLAAIHARGLIHCDIKPGTVWLVDNGPQATALVKIVNIGLARAAGDRINVPDIGASDYMAPELAAGEPIDHRADLFSIGCLLYRMWSGQIPIPGADLPMARNRDVPRELSDLVMRLLARKPDQRPESATATATALEAIEHPRIALPGARPRRAWPWFAGANVVVVAVLAYWLVSRGDRPALPPIKIIETIRTPPDPVVETKPIEPVALHCTATLTGHTDDIRWVAFEPRNGKALASCAQDKTVRIWDLTPENKAPLVLTGHIHHVIGLDWRKDGMMLASGGEGGIILWRADGKKIADLKGHTGGISGVAFSSDGARLASSSHDQTVRVWNPEVPQEAPLILPAPKGKGAYFSSVVWGSDNQTVFAVSGDGKLVRWDVLNPNFPEWIQAHNARIETVAISPDGQTLASAAYDRSAKLWTKDLKPLGTLNVPCGDVLCVAFSFDGRLVAASGSDGLVHLWDRASKKLLAVGTGHSGRVWAVAFSPDGQVLATGAGDRTVRLWDIAEFTPR